jgi:autotransporter strand-loop-strand O-heptosyltransferase
METPKIYVHGSYIGTTGYNNHTRDFLRELCKHTQVKVRNFTVGKTWEGYNLTPHDKEPYINDVDKSLLYKQILYNSEGKLEDFQIYPEQSKEFFHDVNIVLSETNHHIFYQDYIGPKIAYNVWESTLQPAQFFNELLKYDEIWVPSKWQRECTINQGANPDKVKVVPEGVDIHTFFPEEVEKLESYNDGRFKFLLFGRWDYRKSTKEIIQTFLKTFSPEEPVDLIVSIDNMWGEEMDGYKNTEERLEAYGLTDPRIKMIHFPTREDYIKYLKTGHVFVSCARSEGWNLPLIEAMACGTPSIYSECCAQMEFAEGKGIPVKIIGEKPANANDYGRYTMSELPGNYYEPDFDDLSNKMRFTYENYNQCKLDALTDAIDIHKNFSWEKVGEIGYNTITEFMEKNKEEYVDNNKIITNYIDGPKVEIVGGENRAYLVEFLDENNNVVHSHTMKNNHWVKCNRKYYTKWKIRVNGKIVDELNLTGKRVLISFESKSIGDTIAWAPYAVEFQKKHNCQVILSTFHNNWFKNNINYKGIEFLEPGKSTNCYSLYRIGWFKSDEGKWNLFDYYPNPIQTLPLQQTASDILGLEYQEVNYGISFKIKERVFKKKYAVLAPESTAGCKEWTYDGWCYLTDQLIKKGYDVVILTTKPYAVKGAKSVFGTSLEDALNVLYHSEFLVSPSSGMAWMNWGIGKHTVMISGFTPKHHEFQSNNTRLLNEHSCNSCWANTNFKFDPGDWDWCPIWKGTDKQHICEKSISPLTVLNSLPIW